MDKTIAALIEARTERVGECWVWTGALTPKGYGKTRWAGRFWLTHRLAYSDANGEIPGDLVLDHLCRNRACCNPAHLEPVTNRENILRGVSFSAQKVRQTHCKRGHEYTPENTIVRGGNRRNCRTCVNERRRRCA